MSPYNLYKRKKKTQGVLFLVILCQTIIILSQTVELKIAIRIPNLDIILGFPGKFCLYMYACFTGLQIHGGSR